LVGGEGGYTSRCHRLTLFTAFLVELAHINELAAAMGRPRLFVEDCSGHSEHKPRNFGFLIRPALEEFNAFVHTLDKLLSESINRDFFGNKIAFETETVRGANRATTSSTSMGNEADRIQRRELLAAHTI
jgi:hypothetical protein